MKVIYNKIIITYFVKCCYNNFNNLSDIGDNIYEVKYMKRKFMVLLILIIFSTTILASTVSASAMSTIYPNNEIYKEGIYKLDKNDKDSYNLQYTFPPPNVSCTIIVLDSNNDTTYKNSKCQGKCDAGIITNQNTIIIITQGEVALFFNKVEK